MSRRDRLDVTRYLCAPVSRRNVEDLAVSARTLLRSLSFADAPATCSSIAALIIVQNQAAKGETDSRAKASRHIDAQSDRLRPTHWRCLPGRQTASGIAAIRLEPDPIMHRAHIEELTENADGWRSTTFVLASISPIKHIRQRCGRHVGRLTGRTFSWRG
jgi:hypothetical protein